jgi:hypothetical protein
LVKKSINRCNKEFRQVPFNVELHKEMNNPSNLHNFGSVDRILLGLVSQKLARRDEFMTDELTNHLFQTPRSHFGMDLASLNIQRGRDHGLAPYNIWREQCGLKRFSGWEELEEVMDKSTVSRIENVYEHVDDIDLFTGGMAEKPVVGGIVGPTFACIIGQQFLNLRKGDRFWYENGSHPGAFNKEQLQEIRKTSLARVVCDCMDDVKLLQPFAFLQPDQFANIRTECRGTDIPRIDLKKWKEDPNLRPQQFSSQPLHPQLKDLITNPTPLEGTEDANYVHEEPTRPSFPFQHEDEEENLQFIPGEGEDLEDVLRQPPIGLEWNVQYNDHELPTQLNPDQYFKLNWALQENRQDLNQEDKLKTDSAG